jgi:hypothetical protein
MQLISFTAPTLVVSTIYCIWNAYARLQTRRVRVLRERVSHMLWVAATEVS